MKIGCIGWGSLIWDPKDLLIINNWFNDGPFLPLEFARQSNNGRITLVIVPKMKFVRTYWTYFTVNSILEAKRSFQEREGIPKKNIDIHIGFITKEQNDGLNPIQLTIKEWMKKKKIDATLWTDLPPKFNGKTGIVPELKHLLKYFSTLDTEKRKIIKEYIRKAPDQINTNYRKELEKYFD